MKSRQLDKLITEALAIEAQEAKEAGALGYMARALVQATMPHRKVIENEFSRKNGAYTLSILAPSKTGLPYGTIPRLLIAWITTEALKTKQRELILGDSLSQFMEKLGLIPSGGRWGTITRLRDQSKRLFTSTISCSYEHKDINAEIGFRVADRHMLWWDPRNSEQMDLWQSSVHLTEGFFNEIIKNPVPINMAALKALKRSPMALDIYCWLTYRMSYLKRVTTIPWEALQAQFGADYDRTRDFKRYFLNQLKVVNIIYSEAKLGINSNGLILKPSRPHISKK
ncbi:MAG: replication protein RepA [Candidatus Acidiferrales bacterium]